MASKEGTSFNADGVKKVMQDLEQKFTDYADVLGKIDQGGALSGINAYVNEKVNSAPGKVVYGKLGAKLLKMWNKNISSFGDFHRNFDSWSKMVAVIIANNIEFQATTKQLYTGAKGDGVEGAVQDVKNSSLWSISRNSSDNQTRTYYRGDGTNYSVTYKDGKKFGDGAGQAIAMQRGTEITIDGEKYYFYGCTVGEKVDGKQTIDRYFCKEDPNSAGSNLTLYKINSTDDIQQVDKPSGNLYGSFKFVNDDGAGNAIYSISNLRDGTDDKDFAAYTNYVKQTVADAGGVTNIKDNKDVEKAIYEKDGKKHYNSFTIDSDYKATMTDYLDTTSDSEVYYNIGNKADQYYADINNDGVVTSRDRLYGDDNIQDHRMNTPEKDFEKVAEDGNTSSEYIQLEKRD